MCLRQWSVPQISDHCLKDPKTGFIHKNRVLMTMLQITKRSLSFHKNFFAPLNICEYGSLAGELLVSELMVGGIYGIR